jgi:hypothetical protein
MTGPRYRLSPQALDGASLGFRTEGRVMNEALLNRANTRYASLANRTQPCANLVLPGSPSLGEGRGKRLLTPVTRGAKYAHARRPTWPANCQMDMPETRGELTSQRRRLGAGS